MMSLMAYRGILCAFGYSELSFLDLVYLAYSLIVVIDHTNGYIESILRFYRPK